MGLISHVVMYEIGKNNGESEARAQACPQPPQPQECTPTEKVVEKVVEVPVCHETLYQVSSWPLFLAASFVAFLIGVWVRYLIGGRHG